MINILFKILFDVFFYFSISSFYVGSIFGVEPDYKMLLFILIDILIALIPICIEKLNIYDKYFLILGSVVSAGLWIFLDSLIFKIQFIPAWIYVIYIMYNKLYHTRHVDLKEMLKNLLLVFIIPGFVILIFRVEIYIRGLSACTVFLTMFLMDSVLLLNRLRDIKTNKNKTLFSIKQSLEVILIISISIIMSIDNTKLWLTDIFTRFAKTIYYTLGNFIMYIFLILSWLVKEGMILLYKFMMLFKVERDPNEVEEELEKLNQLRAELFVTYEQPKEYNVDWAIILCYTLIAIVVIILLLMLYRYMTKKNIKQKLRNGALVYREKISDETKKKPKKPRINKKNYRESIRYYYMMFLIHCVDNKIKLIKADTTMSIYNKYSEKDKTREEASYKLRQIYKRVRYNMDYTVTKDDVIEARECVKFIVKNK